MPSSLSERRQKSAHRDRSEEELKVAEIRALGAEELARQLETAGRELLDLRFRLETKQLVNNREIRRAKKDIARLKTIIREKELALR